MPKTDSGSVQRPRCKDPGTSPAEPFAVWLFRTKAPPAIWRHQPHLQLNTRMWLAQSAFNEHVSEYCSYLQSRQYAEETRRVYLCCVAHFAHWMMEERVQLRRLDKPVVNRFLLDHLPRCDCPGPVRKGLHDNRAALVQLLQILRARGAISAAQRRPTHVEGELAAFDQYMEQTRGLARNTRKQRVQIIRWFLAECFDSTRVVLARLKPTDIRQFMLNRMSGWSTGSKQVIAGALRCYLQFRALAGDHVRALLAAVPKVANWRLAALPELLSEAELKQLLRSFDQSVPSAKRAYAMVRCLVDLGLRSSEVVHLHLDNIDWHAGTIRLTKGKSRRADILPLPLETGRAIADYLVAERPKTTNRAVFVRHKAPFDEPIKAGVIGQIVRQAYQRCGWSRTRVHILRHSMASRLLRAGSPLKEIADVLRHRSLDTSAIYTKVDVNRLAAAALPWPGSAS
jgi:integrase/recombinase XerD